MGVGEFKAVSPLSGRAIVSSLSVGEGDGKVSGRAIVSSLSAGEGDGEVSCLGRLRDLLGDGEGDGEGGDI